MLIVCWFAKGVCMYVCMYVMLFWGAKVWKSLRAPVLVHSFRKSAKAALTSEGLAVRLETHY